MAHPALKNFDPHRHMNYDWKRNIPFTNANFYLYKHGIGLIDWSRFSEWSDNKVNRERLEKYQQAFKTLDEQINNGVLTLCYDKKERVWKNIYN